MKIGALNFFPAFNPPRSGGEQRYVHLYMRLGKHHSVELVNPTYPDHARESIQHSETVVEHRFPKTPRYIWWHRFLDRVGHFKECSALVTGLSAASHRNMAAEARRLWRECDVLVHEFPYLIDLAPRAREGQLMVYDAHNVEYRLALEMFPGLAGRWAARRVRAFESRCARAADVVLACSAEDALELERLYGLDSTKIHVVPNGVDPREIRPCDPRERPAVRARLGLAPERFGVLFFGSYHPPNLEAAQWIAAQLAPVLPDMDFFLAGRVCKALEGKSLPPNIRLMGMVDESVKMDLLQGCDAAINPMFTGSGTNLKMLEYMSAGLAPVSTPRGARGLGVESGRCARVVEATQFAVALEEFRASLPASSSHFPHAPAHPAAGAGLAAEMGAEARKHVIRHFSWDAIAEKVHHIFQCKARRRVLLINDFPVTPVHSGGQVRLLAAGRQLAARGHGVTILTLSTDSAPARRMLEPGLEEINIPRTPAQRAMDLWLYHQVGVGMDDISAYLFGRWLTPRFARVLRREARLAQAVIFSHCYLIPMRRYIPRGGALLHEAYNVEADLKRQLYNSSFAGRTLRRTVERAEAQALRETAVTSCVSGQDIKTFREWYPALQPRYLEAPNGVDCAQYFPLSAERKQRLRSAAGMGAEPVALFLASGHPPNAEAARFILDELAPVLPGVTFLITGQACGWFVSHPAPSNAALLGIVPEAVKNFLLMTSDIALNPMFQGSGTNIKVLDYLAAGLPSFTTPVGARGLGEVAGEGLIIREAKDFAAGIMDLLGNPAEYARRAQAARRAALEKFDWSVTLEDFLGEIETLTEKKGAS